MRRILFAVLLVVACATGAAADSTEDAFSAYERGDDVLAAQLFRRLAEQGYPQSQYVLGTMYANGQGVSKDYQEAMKWFRKAAEQGLVDVQYKLGMVYQFGNNVPQDFQEAMKWYRKAAEQGHAEAQYYLGMLYSNERGISKDHVRSYMWYTLAIAKVHPDVAAMGKRLRDDVASQMTAAQIEKAQKMARRCQETKFKECG